MIIYSTAIFVVKARIGWQGAPFITTGCLCKFTSDSTVSVLCNSNLALKIMMCAGLLTLTVIYEEQVSVEFGSWSQHS